MDDFPRDHKQSSAIRPFGQAVKIAFADSRALISGPLFWPSLIVASCLSAATGPYQTYSRMDLWERLAFWSPTTVVSVISLTFLAYFLRALDRHQKLHWLVRACIVAFIGLIPVSLLAWAVIELVIGTSRPALEYIALLARLSAPVVFGATISIHYLVRRAAQKDAELNAALAATANHELASAASMKHSLSTAPARQNTSVEAITSVQHAPNLLRERLPSELGSEIVCVQAQNHYVDVTTTLGTARVLMRMRDAEADLANLSGMRVHRSWWVNMDHITGTQPRGASISLTLTTGQIVPVGRNLRQAVVTAIQNMDDQAAQ